MKHLQPSRLLIRRFGTLPVWVEAKLAAAELAQLEAWGERVLEAATLEEIWLNMDSSQFGALCNQQC